MLVFLQPEASVLASSMALSACIFHNLTPGDCLSVYIQDESLHAVVSLENGAKKDVQIQPTKDGNISLQQLSDSLAALWYENAHARTT